MDDRPSVRMVIIWAASDHCYYVLPCDRQKNPLHESAAVSNAPRREEYPRWQAGPGITSGWLTCPCQLGRAAGFQVDSCYLLTGQTKQPIALLKLCLLPDNFSYFHRDKSDTSKHNNANTSTRWHSSCVFSFDGLSGHFVHGSFSTHPALDQPLFS